MGNPISILHLVSRNQARGAELVAMELADELDRLGHRNRVVALSRAYDGGHGTEIETLSSTDGNRLYELPVWAARLRRALAHDPVDVVLAHGGWTPHVAVAATGRDGPLVVWQRILPFADKVWGPALRRIQAAVAHRCDAAVVLTADMAAEMRRLDFRGPVWTIPNFRKPDRFLEVDRDEASARLRRELGVPAEVALIGYVGHLTAQKRPERLLDVLSSLLARGCACHLVVAGSGPMAGELRRRADRLGVSGSVTFLGHRSDVEWIFGGADLALLTSESEGIPGVAIEAVMSGCPMVTVPVGGVAEVVEDGVTGIVLDAYDPVTMADAVADLLADDDLRADMSEAGPKRADGLAAASTAATYAERLTSALQARESR